MRSVPAARPESFLRCVWRKKRCDCARGLATAQFNLGGLYYEGNSVGKDIAQAIEWYTRSAEQREELALLKLGNLYQKGVGVELNPQRAVIAYSRGSVKAANHLGFMFRKGLGVERDDALAYALYLKSVSGPDTPDIAEEKSYRGTAYFRLGEMAEKGEGVERDLRAARRWYSRGAACGQSHCVEATARLRTQKRSAGPSILKSGSNNYRRSTPLGTSPLQNASR